MDVIKIPFAETIGITRNSDEILELPFSHAVQNHLQTIHAAAQFTLAETASGEILQKLFPELVNKVIPVIRSSSAKYKKPAQKTITAFPSVTDEAVAKFKEQFQKKNRALITVNVDIKDDDGTTTTTAEFNWFIQSIEHL